MRKQNLGRLLLIFSISLTLFGCGENEELSNYEKEMGEFSESVINLDNNINAINTDAEDSVEKLLGYLDDMDAEFIALAEMQVPDQFISNENLADEASEYMTAAVAAYHEIFTSTEVDEYSLTLASESYKRAMTRLHYISDILQGNIPEGEGITVIHADETTEETTEESISE